MLRLTHSDDGIAVPEIRAIVVFQRNCYAPEHIEVAEKPAGFEFPHERIGVSSARSNQYPAVVRLAHIGEFYADGGLFPLALRLCIRMAKQQQAGCK